MKTFEDIQALGVEAIHEATHISRDQLGLLLSKSYGSIARIQFNGFISILEREYGVNLDDIRHEYTSFYAQSAMEEKYSVVLHNEPDPRLQWIKIGAGAIAGVLLIGYLLQMLLSHTPKEEVLEVEAPLQEEPQPATVSATPIESNSSIIDTNATTAVMGNDIHTGSTIAGAVNIQPLYKVWVGVIDQTTQEKSQKITADPITVDSTKNWLIVLGHGRIEITTATGKLSLKEGGAVYFAYEQGRLTRLSKEEFIQRNHGKVW